MKILLTGATGFIGKQLGKELVKLGYEVNVLVRNVNQAAMLLPFPHQAFEWKDINALPPKAAFEKCDALIHLAGEPIAGKRWTKNQKEKVISSRVNSTQNLIKALQQYDNHQIQRILFASAIGYYGNRSDQILDEKSKAGMGFLAETCVAWEKAIHQVDPLKISSAIVRIGIVLGSQGGMLKEVLPLFQKGVAGNLGNGKQWLPWIHLQDLINIFTFLLSKKDFEGVVNASAPHPVTNREFTKSLSGILQKTNFMHAPAAALKLALGEMSQMLLGSARVIPAKLLELGFHFKFNLLTDALKNILNRDKGDEEYIAEQFIPKTPEEIFPFFADAKNLEKITPDFLHFTVLGMNTPKIETGSLINYSLKIHGIPAKWITKIESFTPPHSFVDTQLKGPYTKWHHTHSFEKLGSGTLMTDRVLYKIPLGIIGKITAAYFIKKDVEKIFEYRRRIIHSIFSK